MAELLDIATRVAGWANDGEQVEAFVVHEAETEVRAYEGEIESLTRAEAQGIGVRVIAAGKQGYAYAGTLDEEALQETLREARDNAEFAEADEFIRALPEGYDTIVGERGQKLSGGQRQRISIARAVLADPPILVLDEATSAVDNETEAAIQRSLERLSVGRTTVVIAHRLSTIRGAHRVYVLEQGRVQEEGTHDELVARDGLYAALWRVQTGLGRA